MSDTELVRMLEENPDRAYSILIDIYGNLVYAIVINKLKNISSREDIEDCVSDIFVEVFQNYKKFDAASGTLKTFISTIAKRTAIDEYRRLSKKYMRALSIDDDNSDDLVSETTPEMTNEEKNEKQLIWNTVKNLGEPDSIILIQQFFYSRTAKEIAKILSMTASAVQKRSVRAREKLKSELQNAGITY